jgi:hypothetical protein
MRLDSSGNLGLGVAPGNWNANNKVFQLSNNASLFSRSGLTGVAQNFRYNASDTGIFMSAGYATLYYQNAGAHVWSVSTTSWNGTGSDTASLSQAMTLDASGNLLVGTTSVNSVGSATGFVFSPDFQNVSGNGTLYVGNSASTNSQAGINLYSTGVSAYRFYVGMAGTIFATSTTITGISDQRLKENIRDLDDGLDVVMALKPRKFDWKEGKGANIKNARGFIAQEFEEVLPDMIEEWRDPAPEGEEPYKAVNANLIPTLVKAIQELKAEIDSLKSQLNGA